MTNEMANLLLDAALAIGVEVELHEGYSGRGMFGKTTDAIELSNTLHLARIAAHAAIDATDEQRLELAEALRKIRHDSLGRNLIFY